ncbi:murein hydrolase activator EnvC family protein [Pseudosulfitobacter koreensis]|uniref:Peptidoglycan DD-metalloendopeptidase family protein n=1 Tax=Pseudosulfitobacter koreensis TaxID=2968472 RepID=A0ABT1YWQ6_9RHOB|nr:peptidoglycan DD-metalloendopeptidase family protein [Pseudosulfitobacter koreense]MCR8825320.1 peptidoglycan DD-metalloendopeptidase family protein [Pseudosulfitobacter koreense]
MIRALVLLVGLWPAILLAQDGATLAQDAGAQLQEAAAQLDAADSARDRVKALTATIQAYEAGLAAMRDGLRRASLRETQLTRQLEARDGEVAGFLGTLQTIGATPSPTSFLHPDGPTGTARAGMLLAELTPALNARAAGLRRDLEDVQNLRAIQTEAAAQMQRGLSGVQTARTELSKAMAERTDLPRRFTEDPVNTAILIESSETLGAFSAEISNIAQDEQAVSLPDLAARIGDLPLPVRGLVLRGANEADAAGIARPGILLGTLPGALVTSPTAATVRYQGPLLDLGQVVILEPQPDTLFIFAGLGAVYVQTGEVVATDAPIGLMGGLSTAAAATEMSQEGEGSGTARSETLYIEVRQDNVPQDPASWFRQGKDG